MKLANLDGRAALVLGDAIADVGTVSAGRFGPDLMAIYDDVGRPHQRPGPPTGRQAVRRRADAPRRRGLHRHAERRRYRPPPPRFLQAGDVQASWLEGIGTVRNHCV